MLVLQGRFGRRGAAASGCSLVQAQQDLASIRAALQREFPSTNRDRTLHVAFLKDRALRETGNALWLVMGAALLFLLVGCADVANLLLARGVFRQHEIAVRVALGAGSARIVQQLLTESYEAVLLFALLIAVASGILFGTVPALSAAHWRQPKAGRTLGVHGALGKSGRIGSLLVAAEVALR